MRHDIGFSSLIDRSMTIVISGGYFLWIMVKDIESSQV
jgi:hypothetical protein